MDTTIIKKKNEEILCLQCGQWEAEIVTTRGANLWRLRHASGLDILRTPPSMEIFRDKTEMWGIPVLMPPNRISGGQFKFKGRLYSFPVNDSLGKHHIHGMLSRVPWIVSQITEDTVTLRFVHNSACASFEWFPYEFTVCLSYRFSGDVVIQYVEVTNTGIEEMPFAFGYHTAFRLPLVNGGEKETSRCRVRVGVGDWQWEMCPDELVPTGRKLPLSSGEWSRGIDVENENVFIHAPAALTKSLTGAVIEYPEDRVILVYETDTAFSYWVLWNHGGGKGFFCPEPQTCMVNAPNYSFPVEESGMLGLLPSEKWSATNRIILQPMG